MRYLIPVACCLSLLTSCDRHHPTVQQTSTTPPSNTGSLVETAPAPAQPKAGAPHPVMSKSTAPATQDKALEAMLLEGHPDGESAKPVTVDSKKVLLGKMHLVAPDGWTRVQSRIRVIVAEFVLPRAEGDTADARVTISASGGSVLESVERWRRKKAENPDDKSSQQLSIGGMNVDFEQLKIAGIDVTLIESSRTSKTQPETSALRMMAPPGFQMKTAILPVGDQVYSIKCYGPQKTMNERNEEINVFLQSMTATEESP